jgi:hypothetical protein
MDKIEAAGKIALDQLNRKLEADREEPWNTGDSIGSAGRSKTGSNRDHEKMAGNRYSGIDVEIDDAKRLDYDRGEE